MTTEPDLTAVRDFARTHRLDRLDYHQANVRFYEACGIASFFTDQADLKQWIADLDAGRQRTTNGAARRAFGDFQTPPALANQVCAYLTAQGVAPTCLVEPTCGTGTFLLAALTHFPTLTHVYGVEIHAPYVHAAKDAILARALAYPAAPHPAIHFFHADAFRFDFSALARPDHAHTLILGNPPWVTNAELGTLDAGNLPVKHNGKHLDGLDALTGKSNFDIAEYLVGRLLDAFAAGPGHIALLIKHHVIKKLVHDLPDAGHGLTDLQALHFDAKAYFDASVDAALLTGRLGCAETAVQCRVAALEAPAQTRHIFGWTQNRFVADVAAYDRAAPYDGTSPLIWRQGVKHDCARLMELTPDGNYFVNGHGEMVDLEEALLYPLVKSADVRVPVVRETRKVVIVPQTKVGEPTAQRLAQYPKLYTYLQAHRDRFEQRRSSIYRGKPPFSIFGVGPYAFAPYKVVLSGFYREPMFALVPPLQGKPVMADDTCYLLGFQEPSAAVCTWAVLNSSPVRDLLHALVFSGAKRPFTKDLLMRIDLAALAHDLTYDALRGFVTATDASWLDHFSEADWTRFSRL